MTKTYISIVASHSNYVRHRYFYVVLAEAKLHLRRFLLSAPQKQYQILDDSTIYLTRIFSQFDDLRTAQTTTKAIQTVWYIVLFLQTK